MRLARLSRDKREAILSQLSTLEKAILAHSWDFLGRPEQILPEDDSFDQGLILAGRAFGKTKMGGMWSRRKAESGRAMRGALIGPDEGEIRKYMIEGVSGILASSPPWFRPKFYSSKGSMRLVWPNGAEAECHSAEEAEYRGPNLDWFWWDEPAKCRWLVPLWQNLQLSLRGSGLGMAPPQGIFTGTPLPLEFFRELKKDERTLFRGGSSLDNAANLPKKYVQKLLAMGDSRHAAQERDGALLEDEKGALFPLSTINAHRIAHPNDVPMRFLQVTISIDPADSVNDRSDETGIVAVGLDYKNHCYVLDDRTGKHSPEAWAEAAFELYKKWSGHADKIELFAEKNKGGDLVKRNLQAYEQIEHQKAKRKDAFRPTAVEMGWSKESKYERAQPVSQLYNAGQVHHVGLLFELEKEMSGWIPGITRKSPNGLDAIVHAICRLLLNEPEENHEDLLRGVGGTSTMAAAHSGDPALVALDVLFGSRPQPWKRTL
jgi:phage terminase large subunit-like protein